MNMSKPIDLTSDSNATFVVLVLENKGLLRVLQDSETREEFETALRRFYVYTEMQLRHLERCLTLNYTPPC